MKDYSIVFVNGYFQIERWNYQLSKWVPVTKRDTAKEALEWVRVQDEAANYELADDNN